MLLEADADLLADVYLRGIAADDVGRQPDARVLGERHVGDDIGRLEVEAAKPGLAVDGEADDGGHARDLKWRRGPALAPGAYGHRWVHQLPAVGALLNAQTAIGSGLPEPLVARRQLGKRPHRFDQVSRCSGGRGGTRRWRR